MPILANYRRRRHNSRLIRDRHPGLREAVVADVAIALRSRGEEPPKSPGWESYLEAVRLSWTSDSFLALMLYRVRTALLRGGVPALPRILHKLSMATAQICIGDPVRVEPGVYVPHGQIVVDGFVEVGSGSRLLPWITIGLREGNLIGPTIGQDVVVGSGAKILGPVNIGSGSKVGANAVVVHDVAEEVVVVGVPARVSRSR